MPTGIPWRARTRARRRLHLTRLRLKRLWFRIVLRIYLATSRPFNRQELPPHGAVLVG